MIEPGELDITIYEGAAFPLVAYMLDENDAPINLSGYTVEAFFGGGDYYKEGEVDMNATITDAANGEVSIHLSETETSGLTVTEDISVLRRPRWDLLLDDGTDPIPVLIGSCNIRTLQSDGSI